MEAENQGMSIKGEKEGKRKLNANRRRWKD